MEESSQFDKKVEKVIPCCEDSNEDIAEVEEDLENQPLHPKITHIHDTPEWLKDDFLIKGYRVNYHRAVDLFKSLFHIHNETLNIWTHLIGGIIFIALTIYLALFFDEAKKLIADVFEKFNKSDFSSTIRKVESVDIAGILEEIKGASIGGSSELLDELQTKALFFKTHYTELLEQGREISRKKFQTQEELSIFTKFYRLLKDIHFMSEKAQLPQSLENLLHLLDLLKYTNVIKDLEIWPFFMYFGSAIFCLGSSTIFHWFSPKSPRVYKILNRIDLASITWMIWGSSNSLIFYSFYCQKGWFFFYALTLTLACTIVFTLSMQDWIYKNSFRRFRGNMYVLLGLFSGVSVFHTVVVSYIYEETSDRDLFPYREVLPFVLAMAGTYILGAQFYVFRIPERCFPGKCDIWFSSHSIWHGFVFAAAVFHYFALNKAYEMRVGLQCLNY